MNSTSSSASNIVRARNKTEKKAQRRSNRIAKGAPRRSKRARVPSAKARGDDNVIIIPESESATPVTTNLEQQPRRRRRKVQPSSSSRQPAPTPVEDTTGDAALAQRLQREERATAGRLAAQPAGVDVSTDEQFARRLQEMERRQAGLYMPAEPGSRFRSGFRPGGRLAELRAQAREEIYERKRRFGWGGGELPMPISQSVSSIARSYRVRPIPPLGRDWLVRELTPNDYEALSRLDGNKNRGLSASEISILPTNKVGENAKIVNCCICIEDEKPGELVRRLPCMHVFHQACIDRWLEGNGQCPICKKKARNNGIPGGLVE